MATTAALKISAMLESSRDEGQQATSPVFRVDLKISAVLESPREEGRQATFADDPVLPDRQQALLTFSAPFSEPSSSPAIAYEDRDGNYRVFFEKSASSEVICFDPTGVEPPALLRKIAPWLHGIAREGELSGG